MLDALTLDQMRIFVAIAESGSFRAAGIRLARAQSAISHAIAKLESQLNVTLFDRSGHRPQLTPAGRALLADMRAVLLKVDGLRARARGLGEGLEFSLSIAVDPQFPQPLLALALRRLHEAYPSVSVRIETAALGAAVQALRQGRCTLAISGIDLPDARIERQTLYTARRVAVVAPGHALAARLPDSDPDAPPLTTTELAEHIQIVGEDPTPLTGDRDYEVLSPGTWRVSDDETKHALILAGLGWGSLPSWRVAQDLARGRLLRVPAAEFGERGEVTRRVWLMHRSDDYLGPAARALREALIDLAQDD